MDHFNDDILITQRHTQEYLRQNSLKKVLGTGSLWGLGTGTVISGIYMGWNRGIQDAGNIGFMITFAIACVFFAFLVKVLGDLSSSMPYAGGPYGFVRKGIGRIGGYSAGMAELLALVSVAAAVLVSFRDYLNFIGIIRGGFLIACGVLILLGLIHMSGIRNALVLQLVLVCLGISAVMMFLAAQPGLSHPILTGQSISPAGIIGAMPFALWFFVGIEAVTMAAEETRTPSDSVTVGLYSSFVTVALLTVLVLLDITAFCPAGTLSHLRYPLLELIQSGQIEDPVLTKVFAVLSLNFILAGLNGLIVGFSRISYSMGRAGYLHSIFTRMIGGSMTPWAAVAIPLVAVIVLAALMPLETLFFIANLAVMFVYALILISGFRHYKRERRWISAVASLVCCGMGTLFFLVFLMQANLLSVGILVAYVLFGTVMYAIGGSRRFMVDAPEELEAATDEISILVSER